MDFLTPQIRSMVIEVIYYLNGISTVNLVSHEQILKTQYLTDIENHVDDIVTSIIDNCKRKKTLGYLMNDPMGLFQYANMAGFNLINSIGEFRPIYQGNELEIKKQWHKDMFNVLTQTLKNNFTGDIIIAACEEYGYNMMPSKFSLKEKEELIKIESQIEKASISTCVEIPEIIRKYKSLLQKKKDKNTNTNEFETYYINKGELHILEKESININFYHNINVVGDKVIVNIHNASNMKGIRAVEEICNLIDEVYKFYSDKFIIICGDSNVYYSKEKMSDITHLGNKLREKGFNTIISRYVVTKLRPRNFFQNSQSAEKGFEETSDDTMFISYPISLQSNINFDKSKYFIVSPNEQKNIDIMFNDKIYAFEGSSLGFNPRPESSWLGINIENFHRYLFSDHMPIYCDIHDLRVIATNNVSVRGSRGINYNQENFCEGINLEKLQNISDQILMPYFNDKLCSMINYLIMTENGNSHINQETILEFNKIIKIVDPWEKLKSLATLVIC
tara:strand:+ start:1998 stop:3512 length:1515 start_codon:yes stop_codon:yes gene_type:complete